MKIAWQFLTQNIEAIDERVHSLGGVAHAFAAVVESFCSEEQAAAALALVRAHLPRFERARTVTRQALERILANIDWRRRNLHDFRAFLHAHLAPSDDAPRLHVR